MKKHFYSHVVETSSISLALAEMEMNNTERKHLIDLVEANLHQSILDAVLSELSEKDKQEFHNRILLHHEGRHEDIAKAVIYLADAEYVTGEIHCVTGGKRVA